MVRKNLAVHLGGGVLWIPSKKSMGEHFKEFEILYKVNAVGFLLPNSILLICE